eukprot:215275-Amphidinium_carterae.1
MPPLSFLSFRASHLNSSPQNKPLSNLPSITFEIQGYNYSIRPSDYVVKIEEQHFVCVTEGPFWILGDVFHRAFPVTYDYGNKSIGLPLTMYIDNQVKSKSWRLFYLVLSTIGGLIVCGLKAQRIWASRSRTRTATASPAQSVVEMPQVSKPPTQECSSSDG